MKHQQYPVKNQPNSVKHQRKSRLQFNTESTIKSYATKREKTNSQTAGGSDQNNENNGGRLGKKKSLRKYRLKETDKSAFTMSNSATI